MWGSFHRPFLAPSSAPRIGAKIYFQATRLWRGGQVREQREPIPGQHVNLAGFYLRLRIGLSFSPVDFKGNSLRVVFSFPLLILNWESITAGFVFFLGACGSFSKWKAGTGGWFSSRRRVYFSFCGMKRAAKRKTMIFGLSQKRDLHKGCYKAYLNLHGHVSRSKSRWVKRAPFFPGTWRSQVAKS